MIELALIIPLMTTLLLGTVDLGLLLNQYLRVCDSARSAADASALRVYTGSSNLLTIQQLATSSAAGIPNYTAVASYYCRCAPGSAQISCTSYTACGAYGIPNQYVKVTASAQLPLLFHVKGLPSTINVQSVAIARSVWAGAN